jgi:cobalt-zinc-cadmium efflux system outer membrane protein
MKTIGLASALSLLVGCATIRPHAGFPDVEQLVAGRASQEIHWNQGDGADPEVAARTSALLARELTPDSAVQIALLNNRNLQAVYEKLGIAAADLVQAGLPPNPIVSADVRFGIGAGTGADIGLVQEFVRILQIPLRKRVAGAAFEAVKLEVAQAVLDVASQVKVAFYRLQGALETLELRRTVSSAASLSAELARRQREAGNIAALDQATEQALAEEATIDLADAETEAQLAREELSRLLGLPAQEKPWSIAPLLPGLPQQELAPDGLEALALNQRLDLAAARQGGEVLARTIELTRFYGLFPEGGTGLASQREVEGGVWSLGPAIEVPVPIFDQRQAAVASQTAQLRQAREQLAALALAIRSEVRREGARLLAARRRAERYQKALLPLRHRITEETQLHYNAMQLGVFQLLEAKRGEIEAGRAYISALTDYWVARSELERAVGAELQVAGPVDRQASLPGAAGSTPTTSGHRHGG